MNYLPFNLEIALKQPERVIARSGKKVTQLVMFKASTDYTLRAVCQGEIVAWRENGKFYNIEESQNDLFLLPEIKECWINVYSDGKTVWTGVSYESHYDAIHYAEKGYYIKTIKITNEKENNI